ncbi:UPF0715 family protein [Peribacillus frigoritolerans]|uniref:UPF0715 family protein n=1 Tax=Peribacillus frigoritolerans TaxID=450367 RepID=UPI003826A7B4
MIPYYFFSLVSSCLSLSTVLVVFNLGTWGVIGIIVISFYVVIPYLLFAVPVQVLFNKHPKKFSLIYFCLYVFSLCRPYSFIVRCLILTSAWIF